jgi:3'-5' exoribonuclease
MKETFVSGLTTETFVRSTFLVQSKERKIASNGAAYLDLNLRDSTGAVPAKLWDCDRFPIDFEADDIVEVEGQVESYRGTAQLRIRKIQRSRDQALDPLDYLPRTSQDPTALLARLLERVQRMPEGALRALLLSVLEDPAIAEKLKLAPAAMSYHHAYLGGLLEHVCSLVELGDQVCDHYPTLRRDLVLAGLVLHDLGKIQELNFTRGFRYTTRGQLVGHMAMALEILQEKVRALPDFPASLKDQLEHIILSHHGKLEFGSPKEPLFPEALVVHYLDDLDSKLEAMRAQYAADKERPGDFTGRNPALKRELFKPKESKPETGN